MTPEQQAFDTYLKALEEIEELWKEDRSQWRIKCQEAFARYYAEINLLEKEGN